MKIDASRLQLEATHEYEHQIRIESGFSFRKTLQESLPRSTEPAPPPNGAPAVEADRRLRLLNLLQTMLAEMIALLSGEKCNCGSSGSTALPLEMANPRGRPQRVIEWQRQTTERVKEYEKTVIRASGEVRTADGRQIDFALQLDLCRSFECVRETRESGQFLLQDPLVINFAGRAAELSGQNFRFDLDADGKAEILPALATGSGFLVFDAGGDGRIADGRELFGATGEHLGDGFADLARLDSDRNGWLDEADPAFSALGVWFADGQLKSLQEAGVGALHLGSTNSPFALKDGANETRGQIRKSGIFLRENGEAGSLQQLDLAMRPEGS